MDTDLNDMLNSIGITEEEFTTSPSPVPEPTQTEEIHNLEEEDINDILSEYGFSDSTEEELEEESEENSEELNSTEFSDISSNLSSPEPQNTQEPSLEDSNIIPENSPTLSIDESTSRFSGTLWYNKIRESEIIIAGIGGIGSNLAFQVGRLSPKKMILYDNDTIETVNMSGQLFSREDVGKSKTSAIHQMINNYCAPIEIYSLESRFNITDTPGPIMMCGFDNMEARQIFFNTWHRYVNHCEPDKRKECLYLDGRLSIDTLQIFCITGDDEYNINRYSKEFLFSDREAEDTICSMKQTTYLACMIASLMTNLFTNFTANLLNPVIPYDLPFFTQYDSTNMLFKIER